MRTKILGIGIDTLDRQQVLDKVLEFVSENKRECKIVITPNPEIIMAARKDDDFAEILRRAELVIPDGVGVVWASKYSQTRLKETVPGCDLCYAVFDKVKYKPVNVYILGAKPGVAEAAKANMEQKFIGLNICGVHDGYFKEEDEKAIIDEINSLDTDILLVGLSMLKQEKWLSKHKNELKVNFAIACGGSIDVMAGTVKRAPVIFRKLGLEWFYRLIKQPSRFFRMLELPKFVFAVLGEKFSGKAK